MSSIPTVKLGSSDIDVTRLISGTNPVIANSHFSGEMNVDMREYFTTERIVEYFHRVQAAGVNAVQGRGDFHRIMHYLELFKREGGELHWVAQTASEMADNFANIRVIAAAGAAGIYLHGTKTDSLWHEGRIDEARDYLACMRDCGVQVGLGTHIPEVIAHAEEHGWDTDFYMACFYDISRKPCESAVVAGAPPPASSEEFGPEDPARMCEVIRGTEKMCLAFKILGASRCCGSQESVAQAFRFAFGNIKPRDAVVVGMFPKYEDQVTLNVRHTLDALDGPGKG